MALSQYSDYGVNSTPLTGRFLAHTHTPLVARAFLAADLISGASRLVAPTIGQAASLARVNRTYAFWAAHRSHLREVIAAGELPLVPPTTRPVQLPVPMVDDAEILAFVRRVGTTRILDAAVAVEAAE